MFKNADGEKLKSAGTSWNGGNAAKLRSETNPNLQRVDD